MTRSLVRAALFVTAIAPVVGCRGGNTQDKGAPPPPQVTVARPVSVPVQDYYEYNGYLDTTQAVEVRARVKGYLTHVFFAEGTEVRGPIKSAIIRVPGDRLYTIDDREYQTAVAKADADVAKATADIGNWKAQIGLAEAELERVNQAIKSGAASKTDLDKAEATKKVDEAQLKAAEASQKSAEASLRTARIQLGYTDIRAPLAGRISRTLVDEGNLVGQNEATLLTTIVRVDELYVWFDVPEPELVAFQKAQGGAQALPDPTSQQIPVEVGVATEDGYPHPGKIDFRENRVDTPTGTVRIRGRIPNPLAANNTRFLYPGLYARVRVPKAAPVPKLAIPEDALQTGQEGRFVYVVRPDNTVEKRLVVVGTTVWKMPPHGRAGQAPGWALLNPKPAAPPGPELKGPPKSSRLRVQSVVAVESGLKPEDRVIVNGLQKARPETPVGPDEWTLTPP